MKNKEKKERKNKVPRLVSLALMMTLVTTCLLSSTLAKYTATLGGNDEARVAMFDFSVKAASYAYGSSTPGGNTTLDTETLTIKAPNVTMDLFTTAYYNVEGNNTVDAQTPAIAPGVKGYITLDTSLTGIIEVATKFGVKVEETQTADSNGNKIPLFYQYNGKYYANDVAIAKYTGLTGLGSIGATTNIWINISNSSTPSYTELSSTNYGGSIAQLAVDSQGGIIAPGGSLPTLSQLDWYWPFEVVAANASSTDYDVQLGTGLYGTIISDTYDTALGSAATLAKITLEFEATLTQVD